MAQQLIAIGAAANDHTGDPIRTAFDKANDNFTELYARGTMVDGDAASTSSTTEVPLLSSTIDVSQLTANGQMVRLTFLVTYTGFNSYDFRLAVAGVDYVILSGISSPGLRAIVEIMRTGVNAQRVVITTIRSTNTVGIVAADIAESSDFDIETFGKIITTGPLNISMSAELIS